MSEPDFDKLAQILPSFIAGRNVVHLRPPKFCCPVCLFLFGRRIRENEIVESKYCKKCGDALKAGATILVCDDKRYMILRPKRGVKNTVRKEMRGKVVKIPQAEMDSVFPNPEAN